MFRLAGGVWVEDSQCGFKLFSSTASEMCFSKLKIWGWGFDMEILAIANANNLIISSVRINDWKDVKGGTFELNVLKNFVYSLFDLFKILLRRLEGDYTKDN